MTVLVQHVHKRYRSAEREINALVNVSMSADPGSVTALVGPSGSGKTTMLRILACQLSPDAGTVLVDGNAVPAVASRAGSIYRSRQVGFVFQEFGLVEGESARKNVALPLRYAGVGRRTAARIADSLLELLGIEDLSDADVRDLSAGQRQRVAFARAQANDPSIILADEPTSNLDPASRKVVMTALNRLRTSGKTVVVATHDEILWRQADHVVRIANGYVEVDPSS